MSDPNVTVSNPFTSYADQVTTGADDTTAPSSTAGLDSVGAVDDPTKIHQLSEQAWNELHPQETVTEAPTTSSTSTSMGGGGGGGLPVPMVDPDLGSTDFGTKGGGNYVTDDADTAKTIVNVAKSLLGRPYVWGGETPAGLDCSGLVQYAYKQAGIDMPRLSYDQMNKGRVTNYKDLKPGDLVGWNNTTRFPGADHIAIYIGNGQIIEAPRPGLNVRVSGLFDYDVGEMWAVRIPGKTVRPQISYIPPAPKRGPGISTRAIEAVSAQRAKPRKAAPKKPASPSGPRRASIN